MNIANYTRANLLCLEVVVGDDVSSDETYQVVESIKDNRLKYLRNTINLGCTNNYKKLLQNHATGDFVINQLIKEMF